MKLQEVQELIEKGFTHDEIMSFVNSEVKPEEQPEVKPEEQPEVKPEEKPEVKPEEKSEEKPEEKSVVETRLDKIESMFSELIKTMQTSNINNSTFNKTSADDEKSVDDILATLIRPERNDKK